MIDLGVQEAKGRFEYANLYRVNFHRFTNQTFFTCETFTYSVAAGSRHHQTDVFSLLDGIVRQSKRMGMYSDD